MDEPFLEALQHEVVAWQQEQLISESQGRRILARYGLVEGELDERRSKIVAALGFLGALLVGIGAITFFAANWPLIPGWLKLLLIVSAVIGAYSAGYWMRFERQWSPRIGSALIFLGSLLFGAAIFLIAQGFHVHADEPRLVYLWAIGILPMAYLLTAPSIIFVVVVAVAIGLGWELSALRVDTLAIFSVYLMLGLFLYSLGELHRHRAQQRTMHGAYLQPGLFLVLGVLYLLSFRFMWESGWHTAGAALSPFSPFWWRMLLLASGAGTFTMVRWLRMRGPAGTVGIVESVIVVALLVSGWWLAFAGAGTGSPVDLYSPEALGFNLLLFLCTLAVIGRGYLERRAALVNTGLFFFGLHLLTRYFDIFGRLLHTSAVFFGAGLILLVGGLYLERTRRFLVRQMPARAA
jgi:uncharacterized membrane protein